MTHPHLPVTWSPVHRDPPDLTLTAPGRASTPAGTARTDRSPSGHLAARTPSPPNAAPTQVTGRSGGTDRRPPSERPPDPPSSPRGTP